jgi:thioredoxin 2
MIMRCPSCGAQNRIPPDKLDRRARCGECRTGISPVSAPYAVESSAEFFDLVAKSPLPVLVDFWAAWCGPCRTVAPELEKLAKERSGAVFVAKVNTEELTDVASRFGIQSIPTFVLFKEGREAARASGAMPASQLARAVGL